ncbi:Ig-like domain-containing protein [Chitinophagaceae bacterium LB-8]|uniref:Ig-like domain-containing protein n=1 Tax=Paraflavisolibacter caeni TaxID=2982496 RepID=A0A9X2XV38_9BACT|nr:hypothetical protein [Paraflavisolibacter caeni]MCU7549859.1 Ig-like domain-containing protein [Paraflavisolibacter caeni]
MKNIKYLLIILLFISCNKKVELQDVFTSSEVINAMLPADGSSTTEVKVELPVDSDPSKRGVVFSASNGSIVGAQQGKLVVKANFENGKLIAKATFKSSLKPGDASVTIIPEQQSAYKDFNITKKITLQPSLPHTVKLEYSTPAIRNNYQSEIFLRAMVYNDMGKGVSEGVEVKFDEYTEPLTPFSGRYRYSNKGTTSGDSSSVSTFFSVGNIPANINFFVKAEVFENGNPTGKSDVIQLTVIN